MLLFRKFFENHEMKCIQSKHNFDELWLITSRSNVKWNYKKNIILFLFDVCVCVFVYSCCPWHVHVRACSWALFLSHSVLWLWKLCYSGSSTHMARQDCGWLNSQSHMLLNTCCVCIAMFPPFSSVIGPLCTCNWDIKSAMLCVHTCGLYWPF